MNDNDLGLALERLVTERKRVGPPPTLQQAIWAIPATTPPERRWQPHIDTGGFTMFSALKFVVAAAIVALFGGFLLAGVLTTPQGDKMAPAAVTESPSPMTTEELLSDMITEEVEPGVFRVINDGVRDLSYPTEEVDASQVDVAPDGSVWLSGGEDRRSLFRLGEERVFEGPTVYAVYREVAPDGSLWAIGSYPDDDRGIFSFDGEGWTMRATTPGGDFISALAIGPDGTVWAVGVDGDKHCPDIEDRDCSGTVLLRLEGDGSLTTIEDWADVHDGDASPVQLAVSPDGDVWLVGTQGVYAQRAESLLRFDGEGWEAIPGPEGWEPGEVGRYLEVGPDGTLWVKADARGGVARFDDPGWTTFTEADGPMQGWEGPSWTTMDLLEVAADGSLWLNGSRTDYGGGMTHYHGMTWTSYLVGPYIEDFAIAPDGSVWLGAAGSGSTGLLDTWDLYVITPEAVAATE